MMFNGLRFRVSARAFHQSVTLRNQPVNGTKLMANLDMLGLSKQPANNVESVLSNGIRLSNGIVIKSPNKLNEVTGAILLGGETFELNLSKKITEPNSLADGSSEGSNGTAEDKPIYDITNNFLVNFDHAALRLFEMAYPKPELVIVGLGKKSRILNDKSRKFFIELGIQLEVSDTRNACKIFDLLATERPGQIAALLLPPNL